MSKVNSAWVIDVGEDDFESKVVGRSHELPVVVDFWAPWCQPCRMLGPLLERMAEERAGAFLLAKVNVDEAQELAAAFQIEGIPAVKAIHRGKVVQQFSGLLPEAQLKDFLDRICPSPTDKEAEGTKAQEKTDPEQAEKAYRAILEKDGTHVAAILGLARLLLDRGEESEVSTLLVDLELTGADGVEVERLRAILAVHEFGKRFGDEKSIRTRLEADPKNQQIQYELGCALASSSRYPEALESLLLSAENDRKFAAKEVREAMLLIFKVIGVRSELADDYRDKLARLLY